MTIEMINQLKEILTARTDRLNALERMMAETAKSIPDKSREELLDTLIELDYYRDEIAEEKSWIRKAKEQIAEFYRPASIAV